ncbi:MAG: hypothetical protein CL931_05730 [Deltaproteobacteria bacterium]|nr:hypothetical protein [Deltaproteobacteria bacterium]
MSSSLSLWQEIALLILGLLALCYALLFRIWQTQALVADGVFVLAITALVLVVAVPSSFDLAGERLVEWSPLPEALGQADERAAALAALPGGLIDSALARIGFDPDEEETGATPETHVEAIETDAPAQGWLSEQVRPSVDSLVALLVRIATGTTASLVAVLALLLRIVTGLSRRLRRITERLEALEGAKASNPSAEAPGRLETGRA